MAYATTAEMKATGRLDVGRDDLDSVFDALLAAASLAIDRHYEARYGTGVNAWEQAADTTRYYGSGSVDGTVLFLDSPVVEVTSLTNGDSTAFTEDTHYRLYPRHLAYKWEVQLLGANAWDTTADIALVARFGFATSAPADIVEATMMLATHYYRHYGESLTEVELPENFSATQFLRVFDTEIPKTARGLLPTVRRA